MRNSFKISTFVIKMMFFALIVSSFGLSTVRAAEKSENDKMVLGQLRLKLWYQGLEAQSADHSQAQGAQFERVEELDRAMNRYQNEVEKPYFDAKRD